MNGEVDRIQVQQRAILADKINDEPRKEYVWLQALGDLIAHATALKNDIQNELMQSEIAPEATIWNPEEFNEIKRSIEAQSELVEGGASS